MTRLERMIPLIGSRVPGPLGVAHLPRLWLKALLAASDALAEGYSSGPRGFDLMVIEALGLDPQATFAYLSGRPRYLDFERWVAQHATRLDPATIAASNAKIAGYEKSEERAAEVRARVGLDDPRERRSALLNDLEDWDAMHRFVVAHRGHLAPIVPLLSAASTGPLGARHLPRFWMKALLRAAGALPPEYNSGPADGGADKFACERLGMDGAAAVRFIADDMPPYLVFERWVREHVADLRPEKIAHFNEATATRNKPAEIAARERAELGVPDAPFALSWLINDLLDLQYVRDALLARTPA